MKEIALSLIALCLACPCALGNRPNIVFLFADDQRPDTIAAHGNDYIQTPHLDRLAANGLSFLATVSGSCGAVCVASRSMLMTGRHWHRIEDTRDWENLPTLPEQLGKGGYRIRRRQMAQWGQNTGSLIPSRTQSLHGRHGRSY